MMFGRVLDDFGRLVDASVSMFERFAVGLGTVLDDLGMIFGRFGNESGMI